MLSPGSAKTNFGWGEKLNGHLMASCVRNICTKNYHNLVIGFQITVKNVGDVFLGHSVVCELLCLRVWYYCRVDVSNGDVVSCSSSSSSKSSCSCCVLLTEVVGALMSVMMIWIVTAALVYLAVQRVISQDYEIDAPLMMIMAGLSVFFNIW